jgi:hypothetical protein
LAKKGHSRRRTFYDREAFDFTIGKILGDGHINKKNQLEIDQKQLEYTQWNQQLLRRLGLSSDNATITVAKRRRLNKETLEYTHHTSHRCYSSALFKEFRQTFYVLKQPSDPTYGRGSDYRKCYPEELRNWLTNPRSLAVFYMDDGGIQQQSAYFSTGEVSTEEVLFLKDILETNFGLEFTVCRAAQEQESDTFVYRGLLLRRKSREQFFNLVAPTVLEVPCMRYKLDFITGIS